MAFNSAVRTLAQNRTREILEGDEDLHKRIDEVIREGIERALGEKREGMVNGIACAVSRAFLLE